MCSWSGRIRLASFIRPGEFPCNACCVFGTALSEGKLLPVGGVNTVSWALGMGEIHFLQRTVRIIGRHCQNADARLQLRCHIPALGHIDKH